MSASLESQLEQEIIADFQSDPLLSPYPIRQHGYSGRKAGNELYDSKESLVIITVSAIDDGSFFFGSGIHKMKVTIEIRANIKGDDINSSLIDSLANDIAGRLQGSSAFPLTGRELVFSNANIQVFGINLLPSSRSESGLERVWTINREFILSHVAS